jgi:hypothetical protein
MTLTQLINELNRLKLKYGDVPVRVQSLSHTWEPEPKPWNIDAKGKPSFILLNP